MPVEIVASSPYSNLLLVGFRSHSGTQAYVFSRIARTATGSLTSGLKEMNDIHMMELLKSWSTHGAIADPRLASNSNSLILMDV